MGGASLAIIMISLILITIENHASLKVLSLRQEGYDKKKIIADSNNS